MFLNLGKTDGIRPQSIIGLLNDNISGRKIEIGRIDLMKSFSFFEVREDDRDRVIQNLDGIKAFGRRIAVESAQASPSENRKKKIEEKEQGFSKKNYNSKETSKKSKGKRRK